MFSCCTGVRVVDVTFFRGCEEILASSTMGITVSHILMCLILSLLLISVCILMGVCF